jgi:superfamily II DNA or RNA helicase
MNKNILSKEGYLIHKKSNNNIIEKIKDELTVSPFLPFNKNIKLEPFPVYLENDKYLCVPKYYGLEKFGPPNKNKELLGVKTNIEFNGSLRPKQQAIMDIVLEKLDKFDGGLISLGCGQGKTVLSLYIACKLKVKTLVIVHKSFLLNQWLQRATEFTTAKIGIIQQNKIEIDGNDIVIGMLQSIAKDKYDTVVFKDFGLVIFDEAHHAPSKYFSRALPIIACKKTLALSATPNRPDKLEKVLYWYFGNILYQAESEKIKNVLVKMIKYNIEHPNFKEYKQNYGEDINRPKTINKLIQIDKRNKFIIDNIKEILLENERKLLILSDRVEHLTILKNLLDNALSDISTSYYIGGLKQKVLDESEKAQVIFATYSMAAEALDIPTLNTLIMVTPRKEVEQAVGRITRKTDHPVQPLIIDIIDQLPSFVRQGYCRRRFYNKKGFINKLIEVEDNIIIKETEIKERVTETSSDEFID